MLPGMGNTTLTAYASQFLVPNSFLFLSLSKEWLSTLSFNLMQVKNNSTPGKSLSGGAAGGIHKTLFQGKGTGALQLSCLTSFQGRVEGLRLRAK